MAGGRRERHFYIRLLYLAVLGLFTIGGVVMTHSGGGGSLAELAKNATVVFKWVSFIQLGMVCVLAPIFAAAAITQEKDSQTFNILLSTPLTDAQIVLGSLLSRLYFVIVLLIAGLPLFCILMVYGGVTGDKIAETFALAAATAMLTGTLAIVISVVKIGTGRTIFSFYLAIAFYLITIYVLASQPALIPSEALPAPGQTDRMSWLSAFHPFLALQVVLGETPPPEIGSVSHYGFPFAQWLAYPQQSFVTMSVASSTLLILMSLLFVRRSQKEGEPGFFARLFNRETSGENGIEGLQKSAGEDADIRTRKPRNVSKNPIAWRESVTGAAAGGGRLTRYAMFALGMILALALVIAYSRGSLTIPETRGWLFTLVIIETSMALFIATTTAATSMTREKESNTIELLLGTPLTSSSIIRGKIQGLVYAAGPLLVVPVGTIAVFVLRDLFSGRLFSSPVVNWEALISMPVVLVAYTMFACMMGLRASINEKKTLSAVFNAMAWVLAVFGFSSFCPYGVLSSNTEPMFASAFMPVSPFYALMSIINPEGTLGLTATGGTGQLDACRVSGLAASVAVAGVYFLIGWSLHSNMVRSFDMTIRKQTA